MKLRRKKKDICFVNPSDDLLDRLVEEGIESFTIHKISIDKMSVKSICIKNNKKNRDLLGSFGR